MNHPNVIKLYEVIEEDESANRDASSPGKFGHHANKESDKLYLVMELAEKG